MRALDRNDGLFLVGFWCAVFIVGTIALLFRLSSSAAAAWVQAIGALLALGAAVLVPYLSAKVAQQQAHAEKVRRANELIVLLIADITLLGTRVRLLKKRISEMPI